MSDTFSVRLPKAQRSFLDRMAKATDRTRNDIITGAIGKMMDNYNFVMSRIEQGEADAAAGRVHSLSDVERRTQAVIDRAQKAK